MVVSLVVIDIDGVTGAVEGSADVAQTPQVRGIQHDGKIGIMGAAGGAADAIGQGQEAVDVGNGTGVDDLGGLSELEGGLKESQFRSQSIAVRSLVGGDEDCARVFHRLTDLLDDLLLQESPPCAIKETGKLPMGGAL